MIKIQQTGIILELLLRLKGEFKHNNKDFRVMYWAGSIGSHAARNTSNTDMINFF